MMRSPATWFVMVVIGASTSGCRESERAPPGGKVPARQPAATAPTGSPAPGPFVEATCTSPPGVEHADMLAQPAPAHADVRKATARVDGDSLRLTLEVGGPLPEGSLGSVRYSLGFYTAAKPRPRLPTIVIQGSYEVKFGELSHKRLEDVKPEIQGATLTVVVPLALFEPGAALHVASTFDATAFIGGTKADNC